jgi:nucleotide-binding universal stress UspA family protein
MFRSLLVALKPGAVSNAPTRYALQLAQGERLQLHGMAVIDVDRLTAGEAVPLGGGAYKAKWDEEVLRQVRQAASKAQAAFREQATSAGLACDAVVQEGDLPFVLATAAQRVDLLILGHRVGQRIPGTAADLQALHDILTHAPRPVIVVPEVARETHTVLVAYDGSRPAARALQAFATSGLYSGHQVHVLSVHEKAPAGEALAQLARDYLDAHGMRVESYTEKPQEDLGQQILECVARTQSDCLVMGAYGRSRLREVLLGSATQTILDTAEIPMLLGH